MTPQKGKFKIKERLKLIAYDDKELGVPVLIDLVYAPDANGIDDLGDLMDLRDLIEFARHADAKLPAMLDFAEAQIESDLKLSSETEAPALELPPELLRKRFVFPAVIGQTVAKGIFTKDGPASLKGLLVGRGQGNPLARVGLLGRAAAEEKAGTADYPFYYATLLVLLRYLAENARLQLITDSRIKQACDEIRRLLELWTINLSSRVRRSLPATRILSNPLAPYALLRRGEPLSVEDVTGSYLEFVNEYSLSPELVRALDGHFQGDAERLAATDKGYEDFHKRVQHVLEVIKEGLSRKAARVRHWRNLSLLAAACGSLIGLATILPPILGQADPEMLLNSLLSPAAARRALIALGLAGATTAFLGTFGWIYSLVKMRATPAFRLFRQVCRSLRRSRPLKVAFARAMAREALFNSLGEYRRELLNFPLPEMASMPALVKDAPSRVRSLLRRALRASRPPRGTWTSDFPRLLWNYLRFKGDQMDFVKLQRMQLPELDFADAYEPHELRVKWSENACVCYEDDFETLIAGAANTAAVYFIDVIGSTELSTRGALSNALEQYSRLLPMLNEGESKPIWRKEVGDGRFYCYPAQEALRRAVLTAQCCSHHRIGVPVGIGLSLGEIYTDVKTGDFLNETANRAARLNHRDELVGAYIDARYGERPFRVYTKYGRLYNAGIAVDEKTLFALGITDWQVSERLPPVQWEFPVVSEGEHPGYIHFVAERISPAIIEKRLAALGDPRALVQFAGRLTEARIFEIFCRKSSAGLRYQTPRGDLSAATYLASSGIRNLAYSSGQVEREDTVTYLPVSLPTGQSVNLVVKFQKADLKGLGPCAIAEVDQPPVMRPEDLLLLERFINGR